MHRLGGTLGSVLVDEPETHRCGDDHPDDHASIPWPTKADTSAAASNSHNKGLRSCRCENGPRAGMVRAHGVRAEGVSPFGHLAHRESGHPAPERLQHLVGLQSGRFLDPGRRNAGRAPCEGGINRHTASMAQAPTPERAVTGSA